MMEVKRLSFIEEEFSKKLLKDKTAKSEFKKS